MIYRGIFVHKMTCGNGSQLVRIPVVVEVVAIPVPPVTVPVQIRDIEVAAVAKMCDAPSVPPFLARPRRI